MFVQETRERKFESAFDTMYRLTRTEDFKEVVKAFFRKAEASI